MIFDEIDFHNVEEMTQTENGLRLSRLPWAVAMPLHERIKNRSALFCCGVELRFLMLEEEVKLHLRARQAEEAQTALIYFGSFQGGWQYSTRNIGEEDTVISIRYPNRMEQLEKIARDAEMPFHPRVVRLILPYGECYYIGKEGKTMPPRGSDVPHCCYLAYGSSITHGSLGLVMSGTYPFQISQQLGTDYVNQGYAGSAYLDRSLAEYLVSRKDWQFASLEMGVNMLGKEFEEGLFEDRVYSFLEVFKKDGRPVFVTDIFTHNGENQEKTRVYREIVRRHAENNRMFYTPGDQLLERKDYISADFTHPSAEGQRQIAERWSRKMKHSFR
ncbi:MAG: GDSL-type esterase/lipase family protein [Clostridiales bacterium]|nr:GDSL-type esterase/lipase family protein [Clostridiales bacterium]